jgi:lysozyme
MNISAAWVEIIKSYESCRLTAYWDKKGWSIGWGHQDPGIKEGDVWTQQQADAQLMADIAGAESCVNHLVEVKLTQGEFDALVDFVFNLGCADLKGSTMLRLLNTGNYWGAATQFDLWDHVNGAVVAGLLRRRMQEKAAFTGG